MITCPCLRTRIRCRTVTTRVSGEAEARATVRAARKPPSVSAAARKIPAIILLSSRCRSSSSRQRSRVRIEWFHAWRLPAAGNLQSREPRSRSRCPEHSRDALTRLPTEDGNGPRRGSGPFVQEAASSSTVPLAAAAAGATSRPIRFAFRRSIPGRHHQHRRGVEPRPRRRTRLAGAVAHCFSGFERSPLRARSCEWGSRGRTRLSRPLRSPRPSRIAGAGPC